MSDLRWDLVGREAVHPLQRRILEFMEAEGDRVSPLGLSREFDVSLSLASYHVKVLHGKGWIRLVDTRQRRGATQHFYEINPRLLPRSAR